MNSADPGSRRCLLALGSNLGNRLANLQDALQRSASFFHDISVSSLYESDPVGPPGQPPYYNAVAAGVTSTEPRELLAALKQIEWGLGRRPGPRWGPRPVDLDILWIDGIALDSPELSIPHPRIGERPFVLAPLAEIAPDLVLPDGRTVASAAADAGSIGLRRISGPVWLRASSVGGVGVRPDLSTL